MAKIERRLKTLIETLALIYPTSCQKPNAVSAVQLVLKKEKILINFNSTV